MSQAGIKRAAAIVTGYSDAISDALGMLHIVAPKAAVHIVTIRWHEERGHWIVGPGTFHAQPGDLVYFTNSTEHKAHVSRIADLIGADLWIDPLKTAIASLATGVTGEHIYRVDVDDDPATGDDGTDPSIIMD